MKQIYYKNLCKYAGRYALSLLLAVMATMTTYAQNGALVQARLAVSSTLPTGNEWPADIKWQYLTISDGFLLEYTEGQSEMPLNNTTYTGADNQLWAFIGNATNGYRIYNKAAGTDKILSSPQNNNSTGRPIMKSITSLSTSSDIFTWDLSTEANIALLGSFYIAEHGRWNTHRMNRNGAKLGFWNQVNKGSCFIAYGVNTTTQTQQIKVKHTKLTFAQAANNFVAGGRYMFYMNFSGRLQYLYHDGYNDKVQVKQATPQLNNNAHLNYIWEVEAATEGGFYLKNVATQKYVGDVTARGTSANAVSDKAQAMRVEIIAPNQSGTSLGIRKVGSTFCFHGGDPNNGGNNPGLFVTWDNTGANYEIYPVETATNTAQPINISVTHEALGTNTPATTGVVAGTALSFYLGNKFLPVYLPAIITPSNTIFDGGAITSAIDVTDAPHTIAFTYNLPFDLTTDLNNPIWQGMQLGRTQKYTIMAEDLSQVTLQSTSSAAERIKDPALWAIAGDLVNGFKIYNKKHTTSKFVYAENANNGTPIQLGDATTDKGLFFLANHGDGYVVYQKNGTTARGHFNNYSNGGVIKYWKVADDGSMVFFTDQRTLLSDAKSTIAEALTPYTATKGKNYVGSLSEEDYNTLNTQAQTGLQSLEEFARWTNDLEAKQVKYKADRLYQIIGVGSDKCLYVDYATNTVKYKETTADNEVATLWKLSGEESAIKVSNPNTSKFFKQSTRPLTTIEADQATYTLFKGLSTATIALRDNIAPSDNFLQLADSTLTTGNITGENTLSPTDKRTQFHLRLMNEYKLTITAAGYATTKLPFAVKLPTNLEAFIVSTLTSKEEATLKSIPAGTSIPANTAIVLKGNEGTYTLTIDYDNTQPPLADNVLSGMTAPAPLKETDFIFAKPAEGVGFYKTSRAVDAYGPNKAILSAEQIPAVAAGATSFLFDRVITNIATTTAQPKQSTIYYNLQGQRVERLTRGIYITAEGRKVVIN